MTEWTVPATIIRVIDGDTLEANLDLGWGIYKHDHIRLAGINAPEMKTQEGKYAQEFLRKLLLPPIAATIHSHKLDKYGRCLATVILDSGLNINRMMIDSGHAVEYMV